MKKLLQVPNSKCNIKEYNIENAVYLLLYL